MIQIVHGRKCVLINGRYFAVDKDTTRAERIANNTGPTGNVFERVQRSARNNNTRGFK